MYITARYNLYNICIHSMECSNYYNYLHSHILIRVMKGATPEGYIREVGTNSFHDVKF